LHSNPNFENGPSFGNLVLEKSLDYEKVQQTYILNITAYNKDAIDDVNTQTVN